MWRGGSRSWKLATESSVVGEQVTPGEGDKLREEDDAPWRPRGRNEDDCKRHEHPRSRPRRTRLASRSEDGDGACGTMAGEKEKTSRAAGVDEDEEDDRIDTIGTTESFFASWPRARMLRNGEPPRRTDKRVAPRWTGTESFSTLSRCPCVRVRVYVEV